jgi:hypothetical protein
MSPLLQQVRQDFETLHRMIKSVRPKSSEMMRIISVGSRGIKSGASASEDLRE